MTLKTVNNSSPGTADIVGGNDWDDSATLVNMLVKQYSSIIHKEGSTYIARKSDGTLINSGTTLQTVVQDALDLGGSIYFAKADYNCTGSTTMTFPAGIRTHLFFAKGARVLATNNTVMNIFTIDDVGFNMASITGLFTDEQTSYTKKYLGVKMTSATNTGVAFNTLRDCYFYKPDIGVELETTTDLGYINGNYFDNVVVHGPKNAGFLFDYTTNGDIAANCFVNCQVQMDGDSLFGYKDVTSDNNVFIHSYVWDSPTTATEWKIASSAGNNVIIGGTAGYKGAFIDQAVRTTVISPFKGIGPYMVTRPDKAKQGTFWGSHPTNADGILNGRIGTITVGTAATSQGVDSTGCYRIYDTGTTVNSLTGNRFQIAALNRVNRAYFKTGIYLSNNTAVRLYAGLVSSTSDPTSAADPLANLSGVGLWFDSAVSANWKRAHNDGDSTGDYDDTSVAAATGTLYPVEIYANNDNNAWRFVFNNTLTDISTEIPASTTQLAFWIYMENTTGGAAKIFRNYYTIVRNDK